VSSGLFTNQLGPKLAASVLAHRVTVRYLASTARDSAGGTVETHEVEATNVPCIITQLTGTESDAFDARPKVITATLSGEHEALGQGGNILSVTVSKGPRVGKVFKVTGFSDHGDVDEHAPGKFFRLSLRELVTE